MNGEIQQAKQVPQWIQLVRGDKNEKGEVPALAQQMESACSGHFKDPEQAAQYLKRLRFAAISQVARNPSLQNSVSTETGDGGRSLAIAMIKAAQLGVELESTVFKHGYLISRYNGKTKKQEITFQLGSQGWLYLVGQYFNIKSYTVCPLREYDFTHKTFTYEVVNNRKIINHNVGATLFLPKDGDNDPRGKIVGAYAIIEIEGLGTFAEVGRLDDLYRAAYDAKKYKNKKTDQWVAEMSFWDKFPYQMVKKTLIAIICKQIPIGGNRKMIEYLLSPNTIESTCIDVTGTQSEDEPGFDESCLINYEEGETNEIVLPD